MVDNRQKIDIWLEKYKQLLRFILYYKFKFDDDELKVGSLGECIAGEQKRNGEVERFAIVYVDYDDMFFRYKPGDFDHTLNLTMQISPRYIRMFKTTHVLSHIKNKNTKIFVSKDGKDLATYAKEMTEFMVQIPITKFDGFDEAYSKTKGKSESCIDDSCKVNINT